MNSCKHSRVSANIKWFYCKNNGRDKTIIKEGGTYIFFTVQALYCIRDFCGLDLSTLKFLSVESLWTSLTDVTKFPQGVKPRLGISNVKKKTYLKGSVGRRGISSDIEANKNLHRGGCIGQSMQTQKTNEGTRRKTVRMGSKMI